MERETNFKAVQMYLIIVFFPKSIITHLQKCTMYVLANFRNSELLFLVDGTNVYQFTYKQLESILSRAENIIHIMRFLIMKTNTP